MEHKSSRSPAQQMGSAHPFAGKGRTWLAATALLLLLVLAYSPVFQAGFVHLDDGLHVTENPHVQQGLRLQSVTWAFSHVHAGYWIPLTWLSHMLDVELFGLAAAGHHAHNLLLHCLNALLLFICLRRLTGAVWRSLAVSALFALHPLHVESVAWISERKDVLSTLFWLLGIFFYSKAIEQGGGARRLWPVALCMLLGLMAKPMLVTMPLSLLLLDYWPLERSKHCSWKDLALEKWPLFLLALLAGLATLATQQNLGATAPWEEWGLWPRVSTALAGIAGYLRRLVAPYGLAAYYPLPAQTPFLAWYSGLALLLLVSWLCWRLRQRTPFLLMGWLWFLLLLLPVSGLLQSGTQALADRFVYVPFIGVYLALVWGGWRLAQRLSRPRPLTGALLLGVCLWLAFLTWEQSHHWQNSKTLLAQMVAVQPGNLDLRTQLARECARLQEWPCAEQQYHTVLQQEPNRPEALYGLGLMRHQQGRDQEALPLLTASLKQAPENALAHNALAAAYARLGNLHQARQHFQQALELAPKMHQARRNLEAVNQALEQTKP